MKLHIDRTATKHTIEHFNIKIMISQEFSWKKYRFFSKKYGIFMSVPLEIPFFVHTKKYNLLAC